jgi:hypothetical protein
MASILGSPASSGQFPTCNLSTVWGALHPLPKYRPELRVGFGSMPFPASTIEDFHDARKQGGSDDGVSLLEMNEIEGTILQRYHLIVHHP